MLTKKQIEEIRGHLNSSQNPLFLFDNDQDGLCSFLLLQKYLGRGKGFPVKNSPALTQDYFRKVEEFNADYIFVLDKPEISDEFVDEVKKRNIPLVWIDHHEIDKSKISDYVKYYNPLFGKDKTNEPVTYLCYQIASQKSDLWLAVVGCIADHCVPDFYKEFVKDFPELTKNSEDAFDILYGSEIGKIARILGFGLKDRVSNVIRMIKFLISAKGPYDFLNENNKNKMIHKQFAEIDEKYQRLLLKAKRSRIGENLVFFKYSGATSMSADISNGLKYAFPNKIIIVLYKKDVKANISARGKNVKDIVLKAIEGLEDSTGGGHDNAVGAQIRNEDIEEFEKRIRKLVE